MKPFLLITFIGLSYMSLGQTTDKNYSEAVSSIDQILSNLYGVISGEKGEARDWDLMRFLFHKDAKLIPTGQDQSGDVQARYMTVDDYIDVSGPWLVSNGFFEKEIHRAVHTFGNITQVFSTYECYHSKTDETPFMRGINSIQLLFDGQRWWIINIYWGQETTKNPIPKAYLPE